MFNQDDNKRFTTDYATLQYYNNVRSIMFIDRDELLFCPEGSTIVEKQRTFQQQLFTNYFQNQNYQQILFPRYNYASVVDLSSIPTTTTTTTTYSSSNLSSSPPSSSSPSSSSISLPLTDRYIQITLEQCILNSYNKKSIFAYFHCFSNVTAYKTKDKAIYSIDACPFHELHSGCLRCKCNKLNYNLRHEITR